VGELFRRIPITTDKMSNSKDLLKQFQNTHATVTRAINEIFSVTVSLIHYQLLKLDPFLEL